MGFHLNQEQLALVRECARCGVVFRPADGKLNAELTRGEPPARLLENVKRHKAALLEFYTELLAWMDTPEKEVERDSK